MAVGAVEWWPLERIVPYARNAKTHDEAGVAQLAGMIKEFGWTYPILVDEEGVILAGHKRRRACEWLGLKQAPVLVKRGLNAHQKQAYRIADNKTTENSAWDEGLLKIEIGELKAAGTDLGLTAFSDEELKTLWGVEEEPPVDPGPQVDRAEELREKWDVQPGQLWQLGEHRLICGDCTDAAVVARVMGGEKAVLCHADPPYGMGKENDGIANDNLYRENLDAFQMQWWKACRPSIEDNGSAYIWGTDEDLWRLWYVGGLKDSERLTFRNEIVWDKGHGQGMLADQHRMYPTASERAIFFMLGEQGFNNNADNYWEGWEPVRSYLETEAQRVGLTNDDLRRICGVSSMYSHWFNKSQWSFIPEEHYKKLQSAYREHDAFKREHDDLKREFYETRAYFDNTHDNMTDVWSFGRVQGDDRHGHATPKPVEMMARAIKSSSPAGAIVYAPFNGTGPELIACEQLGRKCRAVEISPAYVAVALERWADMTGQEPELVDG